MNNLMAALLIGLDLLKFVAGSLFICSVLPLLLEVDEEFKPYLSALKAALVILYLSILITKEIELVEIEGGWDAFAQAQGRE